jgi:hypothetical protein
MQERDLRESPGVSTPGSDTYSPYPSSEINPSVVSSPLVTQSRTTVVRQPSPRTPSKTETDGDEKLKNFFQSLLVNKGR